MTASNRLSITNKTKGKLPRLPFGRIKTAVLGEKYDLSLVFVNDDEARAISLQTKDKDYVPNVLAFELGENGENGAGEIFICPAEARRQAPSFGRSPSNMIAYLFIHALCHLKGMRHGATMERTEAKFRKRFGV